MSTDHKPASVYLYLTSSLFNSACDTLLTPRPSIVSFRLPVFIICQLNYSSFNNCVSYCESHHPSHTTEQTKPWILSVAKRVANPSPLHVVCTIENHSLYYLWYNRYVSLRTRGGAFQFRMGVAIWNYSASMHVGHDKLWIGYSVLSSNNHG